MPSNVAPASPHHMHATFPSKYFLKLPVSTPPPSDICDSPPYPGRLLPSASPWQPSTAVPPSPAPPCSGFRALLSIEIGP